MLRKTLILLITLVVTLFFTNCAITGMYGPTGLITTTKIGFYSGTGKPSSKKGESCARSILGIIAFGDASIETAQKKGGINEISHVSYKLFNLLLLYSSLCTEVSGN